MTCHVRSLALREALIRLDGNVWTGHRGGPPDKADCHSVLAAPGPAECDSASRRGGHLPPEQASWLSFCVHGAHAAVQNVFFFSLIAKPPIFFLCVCVSVCVCVCVRFNFRAAPVRDRLAFVGEQAQTLRSAGRPHPVQLM